MRNIKTKNDNFDCIFDNVKWQLQVLDVMFVVL